MEYHVGSIAALVTGKKTPKKQKMVLSPFVRSENKDESPVVKKSPKKKSKAFLNSPSVENSAETSPVQKKPKKLKAKRSSEISELSEIEPELSSKKNRHNGDANPAVDFIESSPSPQKSNKKKSKRKISEASEHEPKIFSKKRKSDVDDDTTVNSEEPPISSKKSKRRISEASEHKPELSPKIRKSDVDIDTTFNSEEPPSSSKKSKKAGLKKDKQKKKVLETSEGEIEVSPKKSIGDINAERRVKQKEKELKQQLREDPEQQARTVYVGNLPITTKPDKLKRYFLKYGPVETVRIRGVSVANPKLAKKVAVIRKEFHPERHTFHAYVRFEKEEDAVKATQANGQLYKEHHIRVQVCSSSEKPDETKAIFVGNLCFKAEDEELWKLFEPCGPIASVRIVRDGRTGMGKGFGYVNFQTSDAVQLALEMNDVQLRNRALRIGLCNIGAAKKNTKHNKAKDITKAGKPKPTKTHEKQPKVRTEGEVEDDKKKVKTAEFIPFEDKQKIQTTDNTPFQGRKVSDKKKKNKLNKGLLAKKKMVKKLAPKVK